MPLGMGLNDYHVIVEMDASGMAVQAGMVLGDQITHVDGNALSDKVSFVQALDRSRQTHLIRALRLGVVDGGEWLWISRSAQLPLPMGLGLDEDNRITEIKPGGNAAREGTIRVVRRPEIEPSLPKRRRIQPDTPNSPQRRAHHECMRGRGRRATWFARLTATTCAWGACRFRRHWTGCGSPLPFTQLAASPLGPMPTRGRCSDPLCHPARGRAGKRTRSWWIARCCAPRSWSSRSRAPHRIPLPSQPGSSR